MTTITKEQAAEQYANRTDKANGEWVAEDFLAGVEWAQNNFWIDAIENKPERIALEPDESIRVLFWVKGVASPMYGHYNYYTKVWASKESGPYVERLVKYFAYINNPYNK